MSDDNNKDFPQDPNNGNLTPDDPNYYVSPEDRYKAAQAGDLPLLTVIKAKRGGVLSEVKGTVGS